MGKQQFSVTTEFDEELEMHFIQLHIDDDYLLITENILSDVISFLQGAKEKISN